MKHFKTYFGCFFNQAAFFILEFAKEGSAREAAAGKAARCV
jgi:hypothetical protein